MTVSLTSNSTVLLKDWAYREASTSDWHSGRKDASVSQIQAELLANGEIPDPFIDRNAREIQWVGERDWEYKTTFSVSTSGADKKSHVLIFEGLDTFATVYLNEHEILTTDNMFVEYRVDVTKSVNLTGTNTLRIYFKSGLLTARKLEKKHGKGVCFNGETSRTQARKAQYGWGWDWADAVMTCGPWRPIKLVSYDALMTDVHVKTDLTDLNVAKVSVKTTVETADEGHDFRLRVSVQDPSGDSLKTLEVSAGAGESDLDLEIDQPKLWYPIGTGEQPLYTFTAELLAADETILQTETKTIGLRTVELVQEPLEGQPGTSFFFKVNGVPVYATGSNWIPGHSMPCLFSDADYKEWLQLIVYGNQNLVRVWGGGFYEEEVFYSECDRLGLMVWQDFMFACGAYPGYPEYIASVEEETKTTLRRLRNHCSLVLYAGNNEDYQVAESFNLEWDPEDLSGDYSATSFPARTIYEVTLPNLVAKFQPDVPYHPGSPWGGKGTADPTIGDMHQWNVWHGSQEKYQNWYKLGGRFVSEFGMEALPNIKTYQDCITDPTEMFPQSRTVDHHNKADGFERRLALYVIENIKVTGMDLDSWIYATQLMQAECLSYAYKCWRREWRGEGKRFTGGAIVWQINDCMPIASWSVVDFYKRPKLAFYAVRRESSTFGLGLYRNEIKKIAEEALPVSADGPPHDYTNAEYKVDIWGVNSGLTDQLATLLVDVYEVTSGKLIKSLEPKLVTLLANQTSEFVTGLDIPNDVDAVVYAQVVVDGKPIATGADWPQPLKYLKFPNRDVKFTVSDGHVRLSSDKPVKGVEIIVKNRDVFLHDNGFDIFPGNDVVVKGEVKTSDDISIRYYQSV
ncbi:unnamed protein product [Kuraishia capsulata CBS 1993]|uniref:Beta-mannosidase B n=1 Tax=Kuraishia capsulata CBS 1993 TaxID=1382522 RepID=W6MUG2_9ASCO|nr:uncharacterized protein KUCA_T00005240001 [Kuraishia capsulata CBS 1993]CDK29252.1 unnamed protein product [Kuraishia capsulata CBS 1993]